MSVSGAQLGRYTIVRKLARGGMADLLLARTNGVGGFERHVVIKRLRDEQARDPVCVKMFVTEARLAGALHHHNIIQVQDVGDEGGRPYFAMEYVHGEDLRTMLKRLRDLGEVPPLQHVVAIVASAATALHHAHEQRGPDRQPLGIVHRDVSPSNVLVGYDGNVKVLDFGIAKTVMQTEHTQVGTLKGKVPYMSPEQCTGKGVDRRSDVFSLAIVAYELCCVRRLFKGETDFLTMSAIVHGNLPRPTQFRRDLPAALEKIILKGLARDPADRYQSADELRQALDEFAAMAGIVASASGLAGYMKQLFGERTEPWHVVYDDTAEQDRDVDFDGGLAGIAEPPTDPQALVLPANAAATSESPIMKAHTRATTNAPEEETTDVQAAMITQPVPVVVQPPAVNLEVRFTAPKPPLASTEPPLPSQVDVAGTIVPVERPSTNTDVGTLITSPPPPPEPPVIVERPKPDPNTTLIVDPLELAEPVPPNQKIWIIGGLAGAGVIAVALFVWFAFVKPSAADAPQPIDLSAGHRDPQPPVEPAPQPPPAVEETKPVEPAPQPPQPQPEPPPTTDPTPAPPAPTPEVAAEQPAPAPEIEMEAPKPAEPTKPTKPTVRTTTIRRPPTPPRPPQQQTTTTTKPPTWDPDALFPKKKKP